MRIGMMADTYKPHLNGITNYIELNKQFLEKAGHHVFVFTFGNDDYEPEEPHVIRSPGFPLIDTGYYLSFHYSKRAKALLQTMDVVHAHQPFLSGRLALRYCHPLNIPIVFTNHTRYDLYAQAYLPGLPNEVSTALLEAYMPDFCSAVDLVISPSAGMAEVLRKFKVVAPISIIPNGVDLKRFFSVEHPIRRDQLGLRTDDILLVYTGRLAPEKNLPFLLRTFTGVAQAIEKTHLLLIGDGPELESLQAQAEESHLSERIHFSGQINYEQIPAYLSMCDAFATASISEVHPLSVIEAMAAGLPVLGIHSVGISDTVNDGISGLLANEDLSAFAAKITRLCMDPGLRHKMGKAARKEAERFAIERTTETMLAHYQQLSEAGKANQHGLRFRLRSILEKFRQ